MSAQSGSGAIPDLDRLRIPEGQRRRPRRTRRWPFVLLAVIVVITGLTIAMRPLEVRVSAVRVGGGGPADAGGAILTANGYVEARHQASVAARTTGRLAAVLVEEGDSVEEGQVVARLIDDDQRALLAQAEANLSLAEARLDQARASEADASRRQKRRADLLAQKQISDEEGQAAETAADMARAERSAAEATVKVARANVESMRLELDKTRVTAPFAGIVLRKDAEVGEIVGPIMTSNTARAGAVVTIADMKTLEVGIDVNESYIARIANDMPADVVLDAHPDVHFPASVRAIFPSADRDKATIPVRVRFLAQDTRIRPDLGAKVTFLEKRTTDQIVVIRKTLRIPASAVRSKGAEKIAWIAREGKVEPVVVTLGETVSEEIEVLTGLSEGDQVVVEKLNRMRRGLRIRPISS
jgi:RND family efflux transporter MFP subunit